VTQPASAEVCRRGVARPAYDRAVRVAAVVAIVVASCGPPGKYGAANITLDGTPVITAAGFVAYYSGDIQFEGWTIDLANAPAGTACNNSSVPPAGMVGRVNIDIGAPYRGEVAIPPGGVPLSASGQVCFYPYCVYFEYQGGTLVSGTLSIDSFSSDRDHMTGSIAATISTTQGTSAMLVGTFAAERCY
jgi:hypothetical protein